MSYAYVQNDTVQRVKGAVPKSWKLATGQWISGFDVRPDLWLGEGWYPIVEVRPALGVNEQYGSPVYTVGASEVTATYPVVPLPVAVVNAATIQDKIRQAITGNTEAAAQMAVRASQVSTAKSNAQNIANATVTNVAQAQTQIRAIGSLLVNAITVMSELVTTDQAQLKQLNALLRQALGEFDSTEGT